MKAPGLCSISGEECFEILETFPPGHPFAGEPRKLGRPRPDAYRVTLVMIDGSTTSITVKEPYLGDVELALPAVWHSIKMRMRAERKAHRALKQADFNQSQHRFMDKENLRFNDNVPIGVLCWERWADHGQ